MGQNELDVLALSEHWLNVKLIHFINILNFEIISFFRRNVHIHDGVAILVNVYMIDYFTPVNVGAITSRWLPSFVQSTTITNTINSNSSIWILLN